MRELSSNARKIESTRPLKNSIRQVCDIKLFPGLLKFRTSHLICQVKIFKQERSRNQIAHL